jgi:hypothetical protein
VDANEVMEGLYEPGDHYWKQKGGYTRALNTANMMDYVIREYLDNRAATSVSWYPWNRVEMGFLATVWGKRKYTPCSKKEAQQHIYDKKAHGRNIKKGDQSFDLCARCVRATMRPKPISFSAASTRSCSIGGRTTSAVVKKS